MDSVELRACAVLLVGFVLAVLVLALGFVLTSG